MGTHWTLVPLVLLAGCAQRGARDPARLPRAHVETVTDTAKPSLTPPFAYPDTRREERRERIHGVEVADPFRWLEDEKAPEVQAWMSSQDALARAEIAKIPEREAFAARLRELLHVEWVDAPLQRGNRYFYNRKPAGSEKPMVCWREGRDGAEHILLDPNAWSEDGSVGLGRWMPSEDGRRVAFGEKRNNSDEATLHVIDVDSRERSTVDVIPGAKYAVPSWTPLGDAFYYAWIPTDPSVPVDQRPGRVELRRHVLGSDPARDQIVVPASGDPTAFLGADLSRDGRWLFHHVWHGWRSTDLHFRDLVTPGAPWVQLVAGRDAQYELEAHGAHFYVKTTEGAPNGRVFRVDPAHPERALWREIVPERRERVIERMRIAGGRLLLTCLQDATSRLELRELDGSLVRELELPALGSIYELAGRDDSDEVFYSFTSFNYPTEVRSLSAKSVESAVWFRPSIPVDPGRFVVEQVFYPSKDGTRISMFLVRSRAAVRNGETPVLLEGYGGFQVAITPVFMSSVIAWLESGGIYAAPNLRGGGEYGEAWHRAGMLEQKQNVFDDFAAAAEFLVRDGWTRPSHIAIRGASNGGLLVGAAFTQRPELYGAVLCGVPLLDMVRYHLFGSGRTWIEEYGTAEKAEQFPVLHAYSPYHRLRTGVSYPPVLLLSADSDDRVDPMHARKFAAALQALPDPRPTLLLIERNAGHTGADQVRLAIERISSELAFALRWTRPGNPR